ncbi:uncharacterized protein B0H18DRAFT_1113741 [Fomitopsis serialis]|uniref:uncharacterized protein n=1 Tax=Fomitopsis serialis TaxID=139415 RepID=UPI00200898FC|nr:uncharacterized protein B0H18DRAFT_1113741 [Neoantrodia serialis]KAH9936336.1 hypothetical protein B0H18DRAFT_1113741 [Neoantrodia serialis]
MTVPPSSSLERGEPWFDDGNIVLLADASNVAFKVHRGMLARHSEIFQSMFELPPPTQADVDRVDGCQLVRMYDLPEELSSLIKALYDGASFQDGSVEDFFYVVGILRLSTKYFIAHLRTQAIRFLAQTWSYTLRGHDHMVEQAIRAPLVNGTTYPYVHPLHVLNLARESHATVLIPSALYFLSLYPLPDILRCDHPKLLVEHPSRPSSELSAQDMKDYTLMFQHRIDTLLNFTRGVCSQQEQCSTCERERGVCTKAFRRLALNLSYAWMLRTGPLHFMVQAVDQLDNDSTVCTPCRKAFRDKVFEARQKAWDELPGVVGLPSWEELQTVDLGTSDDRGPNGGATSPASRPDTRREGKR